MSAGLLRTIKSRIKSVDNTQKITRAMEMVSAAKLRRFQKMMSQAQPYSDALEEMLLRLVQDQKGGEDSKSSYSHPFFEAQDSEKEALLVLSADSGLCGPYNANIIEVARKLLPQKETTPILMGVGKSAINALVKDGYEFQTTFVDTKASEVEPTIKSLKQQLEDIFLSGQVGSVHVLYTKFISAAKQKAVVEKILPFEQIESSEEESGESSGYIYEPSPEFLFNKLIPAYFESKVRRIVMESFVSEHMARMQAMNQATKNAKDMIDSLVLTRNKLRQAIITKEIIEIISGAKSSKQ